jgi:CrcB protein
VAARTDPARLVAVAVGGVLGSWLRWRIGVHWPVRLGQFPTTTLVINLTGALVLGGVVAAWLERRPRRLVAHALVGTGVIGSYTTFSTMAVEAVTLVELGHVVRAGTYLALSLVLGVGVFAVGLRIGRAALGRP